MTNYVCMSYLTLIKLWFTIRKVFYVFETIIMKSFTIYKATLEVLIRQKAIAALVKIDFTNSEESESSKTKLQKTIKF